MDLGTQSSEFWSYRVLAFMNQGSLRDLLVRRDGK